MSNPLVNQGNKTPEAQEREKLAAAATTEPAQTASPIPTPMVAAAFTMQDIEDAVKKVLAEAAVGKPAKPKKLVEPDWATLTEKEAYDPQQAVYIPVYDHQIPEYMNIELADPEYVPVWGSTDRRRAGQLEAEGYEILRPHHVKKGFKLPLVFNSEGLYMYQDVVAYRVHKRIVFGKHRRYQMQTIEQLKPVMRMTKAIDNLIRSDSEHERGGIYDYDKGTRDFEREGQGPRSGDISHDPELARAFQEGHMSFTRPQSEV